MVAVVAPDCLLQNAPLIGGELFGQRLLFTFRRSVGRLGIFLRLKLRRQVVAVDRVVRGGQHRTLDAVLKFAHVPRPLPREQHVHRRFRKTRHLLAVLETHPFHEMLRQKQHIARPGREIGHGDGEHRKPVVEILAEPPLGHHLLQIAARRRDEADVGTDLGVRPDAGERALLQEAQQLHLKRHREVADFIQEQRATVRRLRAPDAALAGVGERPLLVSEKLGLDQRLRQRRTVERDKWLVLAQGQALQRAGDQLLARAARATDQHRRVRRRHLTDLLIHRAHFAAVADDVARRIRKHVTETAVFGFEFVALFALLEAHTGGVRRDVGDDLKKRDIAMKRLRRRFRRVRTVDGKRTDHLTEMDERHAHERDGVLLATCTGTIQESAVLVDIRHNLHASRLGHRAGDALAQPVMSVSLLLRAQPTRGLDRNLIAVQEGERSAQHTHAVFKNVQNLFENVPHVPFTDQNGTDFP